MGIHEKIQRSIEQLFFKGKSTKLSLYLTYAIGNITLMLIVFYVFLNTVAYNWTGQLYPAGSGYNLSFILGGLDNAIPFIPEWVIFYVYLFYPLVILTMLFFAFAEYKKGYALGWALAIINAISILIYIAFPVSTYSWRQDYLANPINSFWANQVYSVWASDSSFNCFPSLHASVSTICFFAWYQYSRTKPSFATKSIAMTALIIAVGVVLSTLFVKQHYIADEIAGIVLAFAVGKITFSRLWTHDVQRVNSP